MFSRLSNSAFRERTTKRLIRRHGCSVEAAQLAAVVLHPFDRPPQSRHFEKFVRRVSWEFARHLRSARDEQTVLGLSEIAIEAFDEAAWACGERGFAYEWRHALNAVPRSAFEPYAADDAGAARAQAPGALA